MSTLELESAHRQLQLRNFAAAAPFYLGLINEKADVTPAWEGLLASLAGLDCLDKAFALLETRQQRFNDALAFYFDSLARLVASGISEVAEKLVSSTPDNSLLYVVARYGAGLLQLHRKEPKAAADHFAAAATMAENFPEHFWHHPHLQKIIIEGRQFLDFSKLDELIARDRSGVIVESGIIDVAAKFRRPGGTEAPFVLCAGMNEAYLDRFGKQAVEAVAIALAGQSDATFHLHIIDPTPAIEDKVAALNASVPSLRLGLSTEAFHHALQGYGRASYYAAARFLRAPEIMAHYRRPLMVLDIDIARLAHVPRIMTCFGNASYGCFEQSGQLPGNVCHASMITVGYDASALRFADLTAKLIARRAATEPFWLLDQMSILVASRYLMTSDVDFRAVDLAEATGCTFDTCFASSGSAKEKQSMRSSLALSSDEPHHTNALAS